MHDLFPLLAEYGAFAVFLNVLLTQAGAPLPAVPTLLVGGALTTIGPLHFMELLPAAITGALIGDGLWYFAGKRYGRHVMALLCRVSLSPDSCVRRTRTQFERWGAPLPVGKTIATVLADLVSTEEVYKKIVGMQMLIEGLAMGSFATLNAKTNDPVLRRLVQLVMSDEAFHHRFGRLWAAKTIRHLKADEHKKVEDWAAQIFQTLLFNLINAEQKQVIYAKYGLDWKWVRDAVKETFTDDDRRNQLKESTNIFRVLIKTLLHAGIITERTAPLYAVWVDMKELEAEGDGIPGDVVAEEMLVVLREINAKRKRISSKDVAAAAS